MSSDDLSAQPDHSKKPEKYYILFSRNAETDGINVDGVLMDVFNASNELAWHAVSRAKTPENVVLLFGSTHEVVETKSLQLKERLEKDIANGHFHGFQFQSQPGSVLTRAP